MKRPRKVLITVLLSLSAILLVGGVIGLAKISEGAHLRKELLPVPSESIVLLDCNGERMDVDDYLKIEDISPHILNAFVAIEDKRFFSHGGIDYRRLVGAAIADLKAGKVVQGGSTITCQLVKNTHLTNEKTLKRKVQEGKIALELERKYSKKEILEMYLNVVYFGKGIYGVKNACERIYGKVPNDVTPREAASLAATVANPKSYSPLLQYEQNSNRTDLVLTLMHEQSKLSDKEYEQGLSSNIIINCDKNYNNYDDNYPKLLLSELDELSLKVKPNSPIYLHTFYDPAALQAAKSALLSYDAPLLKDGENPVKEILIADNGTRGILAYISNKELSREEKRQPGSLLKPFIYASAIEEGKLLPESPKLDAPADFSGYRPENYKSIYYGWISARDALAKSSNSVSVGILRDAGIEESFRIIEKCGIPLSDKDRNFALALGGTTYGSTLSELCEGYMTLANGGIHHDLKTIREIRDEKGRILYRPVEKGEVAFSHSTAYLVTDMLKTATKTGTAKQLAQIDFELAAKTGTVAKGEGNADAWCAAYTSAHTFLCHYSSKDSHIPMDSTVTGGNQPTKAARAAIKAFYSEPPPPFLRPISLQKREIDKTLKDELHKLILYKDHEYGEGESVYVTGNYVFDAFDPDDYFLKGLSLSASAIGTEIRFKEAEGVNYDVYLNGCHCEKIGFVHLAEHQIFPIGKLEIYCKKKDRILYKKTKIARVY